ncbi:carboxymuconolactone decarboxylase family protein [Kocuria kalidii]|uniref:carboxymuconolactone decarboxylase family protein n=1 Tax=Kocuria kalidii TaxID=3376283 RepID=UPI0037ABDCBB
MAPHHHSPRTCNGSPSSKNRPPRNSRPAKIDGTIGREGRAIDQLHRELIAVGVAISSQDPRCSQVHVTHTWKARATPAQIAQAAMIAADLGAGAAVTHGTMALRIFDEA